MRKKAADLIAETLSEAGAKRLYGIVGDSLNGFTEALRRRGDPALLDVVTARQELAMPPHVEREQVTGFGLWLIRAVLDGRGEQIIDLAQIDLTR
jgi:hypothetical protein